MDKIEELIEWLKGEKYGYLLSDHKTWVNYGELKDIFEYDEDKKKYELGCNRMVDKTVNKINELFNIKKEGIKMENKIVSITKGKEITFENGETKNLEYIRGFNEYTEIKRMISRWVSISDIGCTSTSDITSEELEKIAYVIYKNGYGIMNVYASYYNDLTKLVDYYENPDKYFKITHSDTVGNNNRLVFIEVQKLDAGESKKHIIIHIHDDINLKLEDYDKFVRMDSKNEANENGK